MLLCIPFYYVHDAESKVAYCITCETSIGSTVEAAAHYRSREHLNRRLQRGLPIADVSSGEQDQPSASREFINECLRRGVGLQQSNAQTGIYLYALFLIGVLSGRNCGIFSNVRHIVYYSEQV